MSITEYIEYFEETSLKKEIKYDEYFEEDIKDGNLIKLGIVVTFVFNNFQRKEI